MLYGASSAPFLSLLGDSNGPGGPTSALVLGGTELTVALSFMLPSTPMSWTGLFSLEVASATYFGINIWATPSSILGFVNFDVNTQGGGSNIFLNASSASGDLGVPVAAVAGAWVTAALTISSTGTVSLYARSNGIVGTANTSACISAAAALAHLRLR